MLRVALVVAFLAVCAPLARAQDGVALSERAFLDGRLLILVPDDFAPMDEEGLAIKYPAAQAPMEVLTDSTSQLNLVISYTEHLLSPDQLPDMTTNMAELLEATHEDLEWIRLELVTREEHDFALLDMWTPAVDTDIRNIMLLTTLDARLLLVSFNMTAEMETVWGLVAEQVMASVRIVR